MGNISERLEARAFLNGAGGAVAAEVSRVVPASTPPANFDWYWQINGNVNIFLDLNQDGKKVSGPLMGKGAIKFFYDSHGTVKGNVMTIHGTGTANGIKSKYKAEVTLVSQYSFHGTATFHTKGLDDVTTPFDGVVPG
ncbi:MAG: hypothetical protein U0903_02735 [Planctomycetales bacterium]